MVVQEIAKNDLAKCKAMARRNKVQERHNIKKYLVYSVGSDTPVGYFYNVKDAMEYVQDAISYDGWLYKQFEDECIITDYWIVETTEKVIAYYLENEKEI